LEGHLGLWKTVPSPASGSLLRGRVARPDLLVSAYRAVSLLFFLDRL
jgi:hypothetical protein